MGEKEICKSCMGRGEVEIYSGDGRAIEVRPCPHCGIYAKGTHKINTKQQMKESMDKAAKAVREHFEKKRVK